MNNYHHLQKQKSNEGFFQFKINKIIEPGKLINYTFLKQPSSFIVNNIPWLIDIWSEDKYLAFDLCVDFNQHVEKLVSFLSVLLTLLNIANKF